MLLQLLLTHTTKLLFLLTVQAAIKHTLNMNPCFIQSYYIETKQSHYYLHYLLFTRLIWWQKNNQS